MRKVPDQVEKLKKQKKYPEVITALQSSSKQISDRQYIDVGALSDLRRYLNNQLNVNSLERECVYANV